MAEFAPASRAVGTAGLTTGIIGTALGVLNGGVGNVLSGMTAPRTVVAEPVMAAPYGGWNGWNGYGGCCSEDRPVNRYEAGKDSRIAALENENSLLKANTYVDQKLLAVYGYIDGQLKEVRDTLRAQAVHNQRTEDSFVLARQDIAAVKNDLEAKIKLEAERRCCADNSIVTYANATFYQKMVADVTVGTTTTAQSLYNPIPDCDCCGSK